MSQGSRDSRQFVGPMLDVLNLINLIIHFRVEIERIQEGDYDSGLFSRQDEKKLTQLCIIERDNGGYRVPWAVEALLERIS